MIINHNSPLTSERCNQIRDSKLAEGFNWGGFIFQIDPKSLSLISGRTLRIITARIQNELVNDVQWMTKDNSIYTFTPDEFVSFAEAVDDHVDGIYKESWIMKGRGL